MQTDRPLHIAMNARDRLFGRLALLNTVWSIRILEVCWLSAIALVPLSYLDRDYVTSEAVIGHIELPKVALMRTLAALMGGLWLLHWALSSNSTFSPLANFHRRFSIRPFRLIFNLKVWLVNNPIRWVFLAVLFYLLTTLLSTILSTSLSTSLWGEVPGQDSYSAYTICSYIVIFGVMSSQIRSWAQIWRIIGVIVIVGGLVGGYGIFQHFGHDFLGITEATGGGKSRVTTMMGNSLFSGSFLFMASAISFTAILALAWSITHKPINPPRLRCLPSCVYGFGGLFIAVQLVAVTFTFSRGPWLGLISAAITFLILAVALGNWRLIYLMIGLIFFSSMTILALLQSTGSFTVLTSFRWISILFLLVGITGVFISLAILRLKASKISSIGNIFFSHPWLAWQPSRIKKIGTIAAIFAGLTLASFLVVNWAGVKDDNTTSTGSETLERLSSTQNAIISGSISGRTPYWKGSWNLITETPFISFKDFSFSRFRPVIGYGPDLFRNLFLLESKPTGYEQLPDEPDHAHNFFIHNAVEQGFLGLFSSVSVYLTSLAVGFYLIFQTRNKFRGPPQILLIGIVAVITGRFIEQMVGVARVSDLTLFWVLLAVLVALPTINSKYDTIADPTEPEPTPTKLPNLRTDGQEPNWPLNFVSSSAWRIGLVLVLGISIGTLTWSKTVNPVRAAKYESDAIRHYESGDLESSFLASEQAINLAPEVAFYYQNKVQIYSAYLTNPSTVTDQFCETQTEIPYKICLKERILQTNLDGLSQRPLNFRSHLEVARSATNTGHKELALQHYKRAAELVPNSWRILNGLARSYLEMNQLEHSLRVITRSLSITENYPGLDSNTAETLAIQGEAYFENGELHESILSLEQSLKLDSQGSSPRQALFLLARVYSTIGNLEESNNRLLELAQAYDLAGYPERATPILDLSMQLYSKADLPVRVADNLIKLGDAYQNLTEFEKASLAFSEGVQIYRDLDMPKLQAKSLIRLGQTYRQMSASDRAIDPFLQAALLYDNLNLPSSKAESYFLLGITYEEIGNLRDAFTSFSLALRSENYRNGKNNHKSYLNHASNVAHKLQEPDILASYYDMIGTIYYLNDQIDDAIASYEFSLSLGETQLEGSQLHDVLLSEYIKAESFEEALAQYIRKDADRLEAATLDKIADGLEIVGIELSLSGKEKPLAVLYHQIGMAYLDLNLPSRAAKFFNKSLISDPKHAFSLGSVEGITTAYNQLGVTSDDSLPTFILAKNQWEIGNLDSSITLVRRSMDLDQSPISLQRGHDLLYDLYLSTGSSEQASLAKFHEGRAFLELSDFLESTRSFEIALELSSNLDFSARVTRCLEIVHETSAEPELKGASLFRMGIIYRDSDQLEAALKPLQGSAEAFAQSGQVTEEAEALYHLGITYLDLHEPNLASGPLERVVKLGVPNDYFTLAAERLSNIYESQERNEALAFRLFELALSYRQTGQTLKSRDAIERSLDLYQSSQVPPEVYQTLAELYYELGELTLAAKFFLLQKVRERDWVILPDLVYRLGSSVYTDQYKMTNEHYYWQGLIYAEMGDTEQAKKAMLRSLGYKSEANNLPLLNLDYESIDRQSEQADSDYQYSLSYEIRAQRWLDPTHGLKVKLQQASDLMDLELEPLIEDITNRVNKGIDEAAIHARNSGEGYIAIDYLYEAAKAYFWLAGIYDEMGKLEESMAALLISLEFSGDGPLRTQNLAHLGHLSGRLGFPGKAATYYHEAGSYELAAHYYYKSGLTLHEAGELNSAKIALNQSVELSPTGSKAVKARELLSELKE